MFTAMMLAALVQTSAINTQRDEYIACLKEAAAAAKAQKVAADAVEAHLRQACAVAEAKFEASLIAFDVKNKVSRKQAASDAQLQVDDFVVSAVDRYKPE
jgi:hypothetical protein